MIVKSKNHYVVWIWALFPLIDLVTYFRRPASFDLHGLIFKLVVYVLIAFALSVYWKKREILFESTEQGIWIKGSKEGLYDPDFIKYEEILSCEHDKSQIHLKLTDDRFVNFRLQKRNVEKAYNEIMNRLG